MNEEIVDIVDEKDQFVRKATRSEVRQKALLHRVARVILLNSNGELLVQKRSVKKDIHPGLWDVGVAETVVSGEGYADAAMRGLMEELNMIGVSNIELIHSFLFKLKFRSHRDNVNYKIFKYLVSGEVKPNQEEVEEARFLRIQDIKRLIEAGNFTPGGTMAFNEYLKLNQGGKM